MATKKIASKTVVKPKFKAYAKDFVLNLGPWAINGRLLSVSKGKQSTGIKFNFISPEGNSVDRVWRDQITGEVFDEAELDKVPESAVPGEEVEVYDQQDIKDAKVSELPKNVFDITVHRAAEVDDQLFPSQHSAYIFEPYSENPKNVTNYKLIQAMLANDDYALMGVVNIKGHEGLYRLGLWRGQVILIRQSYPGDIYDHEAVEAEVNEAVAAKLAETLDHFATDYDADTYRNTVNEKLLSFLAGEVNERPETETSSEDDALLAQLEALGL